MKNIAPARTAQKPNKIPPRSQKECFGCGDAFSTYQKDNYDYCRSCAINGNRCVTKKNQCAECGNGSGWIKFKNQPLRACKLCSLQPKIIQKEAVRG